MAAIVCQTRDEVVLLLTTQRAMFDLSYNEFGSQHHPERLAAREQRVKVRKITGLDGRKNCSCASISGCCKWR